MRRRIPADPQCAASQGVGEIHTALFGHETGPLTAANGSRVSPTGSSAYNSPILPAKGKTPIFPLSGTFVLSDEQVQTGQDAEAGDDLPEPLALHSIGSDDPHIKPEKFQKRHPRGHDIIYGAAQDIGDAARCSGHHLQRLSDGDGIQWRKAHTDHEGNRKNGAADAGQPGHEADERAQRKQDEALRPHGAAR